MDNTNSYQEIWKLNSQQHVSLDKHNRMIQDALQWQSTSDHANHDRTPFVNMLRARIADVLTLLTRPVGTTENRSTQEAKAT